jgi:ferrous iron transport protein B
VSGGLASGLPLITIAGNPNTGKTSIFNRLTGENLKIGNYPGVTVERYESLVALTPGRRVSICDVPGTYSLSARSAEEQIAILAVAGIPPLNPPDLTVIVVDATQLSRNLYLVLQVIEAGGPAIVALNMVDMLQSRGLTIDHAALEKLLGIPVVTVSGLTGKGVPELRKRMAEVLDDPSLATAVWQWAPTEPNLAADVETVANQLPTEWLRHSPIRRRALAMWSLLSIDEHDELHYISDELRKIVIDRRAHAEAAGRELEREIIESRFHWIDGHLHEIVREIPVAGPSRTERLDALLLHPIIGFALFLTVMGVVFQSLFSWSDPAIGVVERTIGLLAAGVEVLLPASIVRDFLVDGVIAGVGSVITFLPQILMLFLFIGLMEDTGYMARVAFLMDRIMRHLGLHGRAFVPMLSGFACAVPAILATRTMERQRDRFLTMMVIPLMTCSARLPVYTLIIGALFPPRKLFSVAPVQGLLMMSMYLFSTVIALIAAAVLSRTVFRGPNIPLILEMPPYRRPHLRSVIRMMWMRSSLFLREAGGVILICTIVLWLLLSFPRHPTLDTDYGALRQTAQATLSGDALDGRLLELANSEHGDVFRQSYGGRLGQLIEPVIRPLGFDWKIGVGIIGAFAAREVFISTLGVVYGVGGDADEETTTMREKIRSETHANGTPVYTPLVGLSLMIFFALACQCMSTLAAVYRETRGWVWPSFLFGYMTVLAWIFSFAVYQGGKLIGFS